MTIRIFYKQQDNKIAMISPASAMPIDEVLRDFPEATEYIVVEEDQIPEKNNLLEFFDALTIDMSAQAISFDIAKAREITKKRLRKEREPMFLQNDILIRDAQIENDSEKLLVGIAERDRLRNITLLVNNSDSLEQLRNIHP